MRAGAVSAIWRYPVSGLQGEKLPKCTITERGVAGDHVYALRTKTRPPILDPLTQLSSSVRTTGLPGMLELNARIEGDPLGEHLLSIFSDGTRIYSSDTVDTGDLSELLGLQVEVVSYPRIVESRVRAGRTLHLLTDASLKRMRSLYPAGDFDERRFRPNIVVRAQGDGFVEDRWLHREVELGDEVRVFVTKSNIRCKMTTMKQAGLTEDKGILRTIERENSNRLGVMCTVAKEGSLSVGSEVSLVRPGLVL